MLEFVRQQDSQRVDFYFVEDKTIERERFKRHIKKINSVYPEIKFSISPDI